MSIKQIQINNFRLFESVKFEPGSQLNIIYGKNASGKTTLLEAIYFLSRGRSFRSQYSDRLINSDNDFFQIVSKIEYENKIIPVGIRRENRKTKVRFDGTDLDKLSRLSAAIPVQLIQPDSHKLVEEGPSVRRKFLDWGLFHVEQDFQNLSTRYRHALKQRNAALRLRQSRTLVMAWDKELSETGTLIDEMREAYIVKLKNSLPEYIQFQLGKINLDLKYYKGWKTDRSLPESLESNLPVDLDRGFTSTGIHRADLKFTIDGVPAEDKLSRGQQKILVSTLLLIQAKLFQTLTGRKCILLIDDVAAELDATRKERLVEILRQNQFQLFVTSIEPDPVWDLAMPERTSIECIEGQAMLRE